MNILEVVELQSEELLGGFALENISLSITPMQKIAIMGQTGSGKSTLLKTIAGFIQHKSGTIHFNGKKVLGPNYQLVAGEKGIAYLSQHFELRNNYRMEELFEYANEDFTKEEASLLFELCKVNHLFKRKSTELSGGEKQRIALTRLLLTKPKLLILDEPYSNLDNIHKSVLKKVVEDISNQYSITCLLCSHDPTDVLPWADELLIMEQGKIIQQGEPNFIYTYPINDMVAGLLGDFIIWNSSLQKTLQINTNTYLRPNNFVVSKNGMYAGVVKKCLFYGNFYWIELEFEGEILVMNSLHSFAKGTGLLFDLV